LPRSEPVPLGSSSRTPAPRRSSQPSAKSSPGNGVLAPTATRRLIDNLVAQPSLTHAPEELPGLDTLTRREHEVLLLVAKALSNQEIADRLHLSEATVKTHIGRILAKLGMRDRTQLVVAAYEAGVVRTGDHT
jgi:DNA-binding NarL/FixJ family response regulator